MRKEATRALNSIATSASHCTHWHIEYASASIDPTARFLSNHLSHGLLALYALGASAERLLEFSTSYAQHTLEPALTAESADYIHIDDSNWRQHLGQRRAFLAFVKYLDSKLRAYGNDVHAARRMVAELAPQLLPGSSNAALHPLIHTGWACAGTWPQARTTLLEGLAYMMYAYYPMNKEQHQAHDYSAEAFQNAIYVNATLSLPRNIRSIMMQIRLHVNQLRHSGHLTAHAHYYYYTGEDNQPPQGQQVMLSTYRRLQPSFATGDG